MEEEVKEYYPELLDCDDEDDTEPDESTGWN